MFGFLKKLFGTAQERLVKKYFKIVPEINAWEQKYQALSDEELKLKTQEFRKRYQKGESLEMLLPEAYAVVKNACRRLCGVEVHVFGYNQKWDMVPYDVQLVGGIAMHYGSIAEMQTGEGKTLTATLPLYLNTLSCKSVHLVTVNDYLAERDCIWMGTIFRFLGLTTGALTNSVPPHMRKEVYQCDIVYGTASEFGFDYLRDNSMAASKEEQVQKDHTFAIIDEIDSILIDEARTPLIISGPVPDSRQMYDTLKDASAHLVKMQKELCNKLASDAKKALESTPWLKEGEDKNRKFTKEESHFAEEGFKKLWLVSKGTPQNKLLKRFKEDPDFRSEMDNWDIYYYSDQNKQEKIEALSELYVIIDERSSEYELTDKGMNAWTECVGGELSDFVMIDMGGEYAKIDQNKGLSEEDKVQKKIAIGDEDMKRKERAHNLRQLLRAHLLMEKDVDYIVQEGKIVIIDENTGRPQPGRRFSDGLHQAIEAKENVSIQKETQTYATITLQNFFRMYDKIAGMTGTAMTEAGEFKEIYKLEVLAIPTHCPCKRQDFNDEVYMTEREKYAAILKEIKEMHEKGRPLLIGTESVDVSEKLSRILKQAKLDHTVLNAKYNDREAEIIAEAGKRGAITIATNMAGRGTDIKLGQNVQETGGLHVIGTTRHQSRRIDRQLRGRCARLGDPGSSKFYVSFEDNLMRLFTSPGLTNMLKRFRPPEGEPISASILNKSIETAQKRIEQRNYTIRKHTLEYDDVMNKQRTEIYSFRNDVLNSQKLTPIVTDLLQSVASSGADKFLVSKAEEGGFDTKGYRRWLIEHFPVSLKEDCFDDDLLDKESIENMAAKAVIEAFHQKMELEIKKLPKREDEEKDIQILEKSIRNIIISKLDKMWQEHLLSMDHLKSEVSLRSVAQKDPLVEFKQEAFELFDKLSHHLKTDIARDIFRFEVMLFDPSIFKKSGKNSPFNFDLSQLGATLLDKEHILNILGAGFETLSIKDDASDNKKPKLMKLQQDDDSCCNNPSKCRSKEPDPLIS
jgi:preprotein translocase subunit SecA